MRLAGAVINLCETAHGGWTEILYKALAETNPSIASHITIFSSATESSTPDFTRNVIDSLKANLNVQEHPDKAAYVVCLMCISVQESEEVCSRSFELAQAIRSSLHEAFRGAVTPRLYALVTLSAEGNLSDEWLRWLKQVRNGESIQRCFLLQGTNVHADGNGQALGNINLNGDQFRELLAESCLSLLQQGALDEVPGLDNGVQVVHAIGVHTLSFPVKAIVDDLATSELCQVLDNYLNRPDIGGHDRWPMNEQLRLENVFTAVIPHEQAGTIFSAVSFEPNQLAYLYLCQITGRIASFSSYLAFKILPRLARLVKGHLDRLRVKLQQSVTERIDGLIAEPEHGSINSALSFVAYLTRLCESQLEQVKQNDSIWRLRRQTADKAKVSLDVCDYLRYPDCGKAEEELKLSIATRPYLWAALARFTMLGLITGFGLQSLYEWVAGRPGLTNIGPAGLAPILFVLISLVVFGLGAYTWCRGWLRIQDTVSSYMTNVISHHRLNLEQLLQRELVVFYEDMLQFLGTLSSEDPESDSNSGDTLQPSTVLHGEKQKVEWLQCRLQEKIALLRGSTVGCLRTCFRVPLLDIINTPAVFPFKKASAVMAASEVLCDFLLNEPRPLTHWRTWEGESPDLDAFLQQLKDFCRTGYVYVEQCTLSSLMAEYPDIKQRLDAKWESYIHQSYPYIEAGPGFSAPQRWLLLPEIVDEHVHRLCGMDDPNGILQNEGFRGIPNIAKTDLTLVQINPKPDLGVLSTELVASSQRSRTENAPESFEETGPL